MIPLFLVCSLQAQQEPDLPSVNAQLYRPPVDALETMWTDDSAFQRDGYLQARIFSSFMHEPLVYQYEDGSEDHLLEDALQLNLLAAASLWHSRLGIDLPLFVAGTSDLVTAGPGLGDVAFDLKSTLFLQEESPIGLAMGARLDLPTSTMDIPVGAGATTLELQAIADRRLGSHLLLAANLGIRWQKEQELEELNLDDQLVFRLGAGYRLSDSMGISADLAGQRNLGRPAGGLAGTPMELLLGGWKLLARDWKLRAGLGKGITEGIGAPEARLVLGLGYEPPAFVDSDGDGILERYDLCPQEPEDPDGWRDDDGCPDPTPTVKFYFFQEDGSPVPGIDAVVLDQGRSIPVEPGAELRLQPGSYLLNASAPGCETAGTSFLVPDQEHYEVAQVLRPQRGTVMVKVTDTNGKVLRATWRLPGEQPYRAGADKVELRVGEYTMLVEAEGHEPRELRFRVLHNTNVQVVARLAPEILTLTQDRIQLHGKVFFDTGTARLDPRSHEALDELAATMLKHPEILLVRIEGHTDSRGSARSNLKLSEARAASVMAYIIGRGVDPSRLHSVGFGESRPLDERDEPDAWETNRRVEFFIEERAQDGENTPQ